MSGPKYSPVSEGNTLFARVTGFAAWPRNLSPPRLLALIVVLVFVGETADMLLISHLPPMPHLVLAVIDATFLMVLLSPAYFMLYRPLKTHYYRRQCAEREVAYLSRHILQAVEEEKRRIAQEMHDGCGPFLTAMQFDIEALKQAVVPQLPATKPNFERLTAMTAHLAGEVRSLTAKLRPAMLESCGLGPALRWHVSQVQETSPGLQIDLQLDECSPRPSPETEIAVYRICQEGLNNVVRHAQATRVVIAVSCGERVRVRIEDDGVGFDAKQMADAGFALRGFGLLGMRERAAGLGGRLKVRTMPGKGTLVTVDLPASTEEDKR